jgi:DNA-binding response OmpR family regulator
MLTREAGADAPTTPPTILIADDDPDVLGTLELILRKNGFHAVVASDGGEAVEKFRRHEIDLLITDLAMPKMNGLQVAKLCKRHKPDLPVLMITAWGVLLANDEQAESGVDVVLSKPVQTAELVGLARRLYEDVSGREPKTGPDLE